MNKINVFTIFMEPSSYTLDLIDNVYDRLAIKFSFIYDNSEAKTDKKIKTEYLSRMSLVKKIFFLFKIIKNNDLIIMNGYTKIEFMILFILNLFFIRKRFIALDSDTQYRQENNTFKFKIKRIYLEYIFGKYYILGFSGGNYTHKDLFRKYGMEEKRIFLIPMMVNNQKFFNNNNYKDKGIFKFLFVGRIIPHKNVRFLIESFLKSFKDKEDVVLNIVGIGSELEHLKNSFKNDNNIVFKGPKYDYNLIREYHDSDILVIPSLDEPWGLVVNEALSAGLPVIASDKVGANKDLIEHKDTGLIFSLDKEDDLSEKMYLLYHDNELFMKYSNNARALMENEWNYDLYEKGLLEAKEYIHNEKNN